MAIAGPLSAIMRAGTFLLGPLVGEAVRTGRGQVLLIAQKDERKTRDVDETAVP